MFPELEKLLPNFRGLNAHVRCFAHTVNLTAKGVLRPFEPNKKKDDSADTEGAAVSGSGFDDTALEELRAQLRDLEENGDQEKDDLEGFVEVLDEMTDNEREEWNEAVQPLRSALTKVSSDELSFDSTKSVHSVVAFHSKSSTLLLFYFLDGVKLWLAPNSRTVSSLVTSLLAGTPLTI